MDDINNLLIEAKEVYSQNFDNFTSFERAIFFSWGCAIGDCTFCYMSTQKDKIKDPMAPDTVLLGLIEVNLLPLKILPKNKPPISEQTQIENKQIIFGLKLSREIPLNTRNENKVK